MPVQKWDHIQDPLDVDKKKNKAMLYSKQLDAPFQAIKETENENDDTFSERSQQYSFKEQVALSDIKSQQQQQSQPLRTSSGQIMSDIYSNPITLEKMTLVNNVPPEKMNKTTKLNDSPKQQFIQQKFSQTQQFRPSLQRFNTITAKGQNSSFRSRSKDIPIISEYKPPPTQQQIDNIVHMYDDITESDDYSVTDLKAQFEEQQKDLRSDLVTLINGKKEIARNQVLQKLNQSQYNQSKSVRKQKTKKIVEEEKPLEDYIPITPENIKLSYAQQSSEHSQFSHGVTDITAQLQEPTNEEWFERQQDQQSVKTAPFVSSNKPQPQLIHQVPAFAADKLTHDQLQQIHQFIQKQEKQESIKQEKTNSSGSTQKIKKDHNQFIKQQKLMQQEQELKDQIQELQNQKYELLNQKKELIRHQQQQIPELKQQITFGFGDNLEKALIPDDLDSQKNFMQTKTTQQMHQEQEEELQQKVLQRQKNAIDIRKQQSQQYEANKREQLNNTQKVFPSLRGGHSLFVGGALARDDSQYSLEYKSMRTQGANSMGSNKKIGGLARRKYSNQIEKVNSKRHLVQDYESERVNPQQQIKSAGSQDKAEQYVSSAQIEPNNTQTHSSKIQNYNYEQVESEISQPLDLKSNNSKKIQEQNTPSIKSKNKIQLIKEQMNTLQAEIVKMDLPSLPSSHHSPKTPTPIQISEHEIESSKPTPPTGIEIQTSNDLNPNLPMEIHRPRRNFQNQVYLDDSQDQLKSKISDFTEKMKKKQSEEQQRLYELKKQQILDNLNQIKIYEKEIKEMEIELDDEDVETEKQFTSDVKISLNAGDIAIQASPDDISNEKSIVNASSENPIIFMQDQKGKLKDAQTDPKIRNVETDAKARDVALDPMICEKSTEPRMVDKQIGAWKRDGVMQTSRESKIIRDSQVDVNTVKALNESFIKKQKPSIKIETKASVPNSPIKRLVTNNGGTQYSLDVAVNTKQKGPIKQEEQDLINQRSGSFDKQLELNDNDSKSQMITLIEQNQVMDMVIQGDNIIKSGDSHSETRQRKSTKSKSNKFKDSMIVNDQLRNVLIDSQNMDNSPLMQNDIDKDSEGLPMYHDHLIEEVLNQKVKNLRDHQARSREKVRNDSRSTQQMFEHQFGLGKQKERFQSVKGMSKLGSPVQQNNINFVGYQNQQPSMFKPLPPIIQERESLQQFETQIHPNTVKQHHNNKFYNQKQTMYSDAQTIGTNGQHLKFSQQQMQYYDDGGPDNCEICRYNQHVHHGHGSSSFHQRHQSLPAVGHNHQGHIYGAQNNMQGMQMYSNNNSVQFQGGVFNQNNNQQVRQQYQQQQQPFGSFGNDHQQQQQLQRNNQYRNNTQAQSYLNQNMGQQQNMDNNNNGWGFNNQQQQQQQQQQMFGNNNVFGSNYIPGTQENSKVSIFDEANQAPIQKYQQEMGNNKQQHPLKHFKGQDLEMYYMEKKLKPEVEKEIKKGFFEIRKKFSQDDHPVQTARGGNFTTTNDDDEEVQVYVSHICLQNYHPIFCKMSVDTVKLILKYSQIVYLKKGQTLYGPGFNESNFYVILFGKCRLTSSRDQRQIGNILNIGWTVGEEILFKTQEQKAQGKGYQRKEICQSITEACVLGIKKKNLTQIKKCLYERSAHEEFSKIEIVLRGNHLVKKDWK